MQCELDLRAVLPLTWMKNACVDIPLPERAKREYVHRKSLRWYVSEGLEREEEEHKQTGCESTNTFVCTIDSRSTITPPLCIVEKGGGGSCMFQVGVLEVASRERHRKSASSILQRPSNPRDDNAHRKSLWIVEPE